MMTLWHDLKYGCRMLVKSPGFTIVVVLILAIGIGATTAILSMVDAVLLRPPPYEDPDNLVYLYRVNTNADSQGGGETSFPDFVDWRDQSTVFEQVAGVSHGSFFATTDTRRERVFCLGVSPEYFSLFRIKPALGRFFLPEDEQRDGEPVAIISHQFWQSWFGGDPNIIGKGVILDKKAYTVVGVLSAGFRFGTREFHVWLPLMPFLGGGEAETNRGWSTMYAMARLKTGVTMPQAQAQMKLIGRRLAQAYPATNENTTVSVVPLTEEYSGRVGQNRQVFFVAQGIVTFVLLIACLHVASLLLIRSAAREREIAVRAALGAWRLRLIRQLLTEGVLLAVFGGLLGLLLAYWSLGLISALRSGPDSWHIANQIKKLIPWFIDIRMDLRTLCYVIIVSVLTCGLFGILPAIQASNIDLNRSLSTGKRSGCGRRFPTLRSILVIVDVAVAFILLIGAGLLINSYVRLNIGLGYKPENMLAAWIILDESQPPYSQSEQRQSFFEHVVNRVKGLPGVQNATLADNTPAWGGGNFPRFKIEGWSPADYRPEDKKRFPSILQRNIFPDYFRVLQIPLLKGRFFTERDRPGSSSVIIINELMARRFWPDENPIGKYITEVRQTRTKEAGTGLITREYEIVGVVGNTKHFTDPKESTGDPVVYIPYSQSGRFGDMNVIVRTNSNPRSLMKVLRSEVLAIDSSVQIRSMTTVEEDIAKYIAPQRFNMLSLGVFAGVALFLACMGVYGTTAYAVSQRTREIGIRMALGACKADVLKGVLRQGFKLTSIGLVIGLAGALAATRVIRSLLYDIHPTDSLTFLCVSLLLIGVALLATYIPARRAAKIDPMKVLRYE